MITEACLLSVCRCFALSDARETVNTGEELHLDVRKTCNAVAEPELVSIPLCSLLYYTSTVRWHSLHFLWCNPRQSLNSRAPDLLNITSVSNYPDLETPEDPSSLSSQQATFNRLQNLRSHEQRGTAWPIW